MTDVDPYDRDGEEGNEMVEPIPPPIKDPFDFDLDLDLDAPMRPSVRAIRIPPDVMKNLLDAKNRKRD